MIFKQLLGFALTITLILFVGTVASFMLGSIWPALAWFEWVKVSAVSVLIVVVGRLISDFRYQLEQMGKEVVDKPKV